MSIAGVAQWLERHVANVNVEGSNPFTRFIFLYHPLRSPLSFSADFSPIGYQSQAAKSD